MKRLKLAIPALVLGLALAGLLLTAFRGRAEPAPWQTLGTRMPMEVDGWVGEDLPLGSSESVLEAVGRLNYHDYIYRVYRKGRREVFVYAMFWRQRDITVREMSGHTPDGCWVANGAKHCIKPELRGFVLDDGVLTPPAEVRQFLYPAADVRINVAWWHIWGENLVDRSFANKSLMPMIKEIKMWLLNGGEHKDQLLVRIHSDMPIDEAVKTPPALLFIKALPEMLKARPAI